MDNPQAFANTNLPTNIDIAHSLDAGSPVVVIDATTGQRWPVWTEHRSPGGRSRRRPASSRT